MILIDGIWYQIINVLWLLMQSAGPTPVAGLGGTTAAFLNHGPAERPAHVALAK